MRTITLPEVKRVAATIRKTIADTGNDPKLTKYRYTRRVNGETRHCSVGHLLKGLDVPLPRQSHKVKLHPHTWAGWINLNGTVINNDTFRRYLAEHEIEMNPDAEDYLGALQSATDANSYSYLSQALS